MFALFSRSRWSDISMVESLELDACEVNGEPYGFLESSTRHQKTGTSALKKTMQMPGQFGPGGDRCGMGPHLGRDRHELRSRHYCEAVRTHLQDTSIRW